MFKTIRDIHNYPEAFYILTFTLAIDYGLNLALQQTLLTFEWSQFTIGAAAVFVISYMFFILITNILFAVLKFLLLRLLGSTVGKIKDFFKSNNNIDTYKNSKNIFTLRDEALRETSDFKLKIFNEHQMQYNKRANDKQVFLSVTFKLVLLLILDLCFTQTQSIMQLIVSHLPPLLYHLSIMALLLLILLWLKELLETDDISKYRINWPPETNSDGLDCSKKAHTVPNQK